MIFLLREEKIKVGQINVKLQRVLVGEKYYDQYFTPKHREGLIEDADMADVRRKLYTPLGK